MEVDVEQIISNQNAIKIIIGMLSFSFFSIISLVIYIFKTSVSGIKEVLNEHNKTLKKVSDLCTEYGVEIRNLNKRI